MLPSTGGDGNLNTADEFASAMKAAIVAAGFKSEDVNVTNCLLGTITVKSTVEGSDFEVAIANVAYPGAATTASDLAVANTGLPRPLRPPTLLAATATITPSATAPNVDVEHRVWRRR